MGGDTLGSQGGLSDVREKEFPTISMSWAQDQPTERARGSLPKRDGLWEPP